MNRVPPHNLEAENALLSVCLMYPTQIGEVARHLDANDFYAQHHAALWALLERMFRAGEKIEPVTVKAKLDALNVTMPGGKSTQDFMWELRDPPSSQPFQYVPFITKAATSRAMLRTAAEMAEMVYANLDDPDGAKDRGSALWGSIEASQRNVVPAGLVPMDEFLDRAKDRALDDRKWVVPGMLRRGWRVIVVATEGSGKSTIQRQLAIRVATGLHPFCGELIEPKRTLIVDLENPAEVIDEQGLRPRDNARRQLRENYIANNCFLWSREAGIDLRTRNDRAQLEAVIAKVRPELVVLGPLYKAFRSTKNEGEEQPVQEVQAILDDLRTRYDFALVMEHHAPHGAGNGRALRPFGSSAWLRWPEFGLSLSLVEKSARSRYPMGSLRVNRFRKDRLPATWPIVLERNREWTGVWPDGTFDEPLLVDNEEF